MAIWHFNKQDPSTYCDCVAVSLDSFSALLIELYESREGPSVFQYETFVVLSDLVEAMAIELKKAADAYQEMELKPKAHLKPVNGGEKE